MGKLERFWNDLRYDQLLGDLWMWWAVLLTAPPPPPPPMPAQEVLECGAEVHQHGHGDILNEINRRLSDLDQRMQETDSDWEHRHLMAHEDTSLHDYALDDCADHHHDFDGDWSGQHDDSGDSWFDHHVHEWDTWDDALDSDPTHFDDPDMDHYG